ncbi:hypothetical protein ILUMI_16013 [Ignelater luminosus]|uniref:Uncharacterized protein n=1 Tax=Ignelater luminosus TaxID=2038154 RepID=A0A8K0G3A7_IGNLU|nr:hypothetical protein ILUMI_16013 [Ignelater luminosus]
MIYGSEVWEMTQIDRGKINATEMDFLRRSCRVFKLEHIKNTEIINRTGKDKSTVEEIEKRHLIWYGHRKRINPQRWPNQAINWNLPGKKTSQESYREGLEGQRPVAFRMRETAKAVERTRYIHT